MMNQNKIKHDNYLHKQQKTTKTLAWPMDQARFEQGVTDQPTNQLTNAMENSP